MSRMALIGFALLAFTSAPAIVTAGSAVTGTISCDISGAIAFRPPISNTAGGNIKVKISNKDGQSTCDSSGVTGGKEPISGVIVKISGGSLGEGATCATLSSAPQLTGSKVKMTWRGLNLAGHPNRVAVSKTTVASVSWDSGSDALDIVTQPVTFGAFTGSTITLHAGLDDFAGFSAFCNTAQIRSTAFGTVNPSTLTVP